VIVTLPVEVAPAPIVRSLLLRLSPPEMVSVLAEDCWL
jgi:hypothetical protein